MGRTVAELERELSSRELREWAEFETLEPFGAWRDNWHAAIIAAHSIAPHTKDGKVPPLGDFFYTDPETVREKKDVAMKQWLEARRNNGS